MKEYILTARVVINAKLWVQAHSVAQARASVWKHLRSLKVGSLPDSYQEVTVQEVEGFVEEQE